MNKKKEHPGMGANITLTKENLKKPRTKVVTNSRGVMAQMPRQKTQD